jgi:putative ubiquitin-RnfH superfamily antitoxin RatB of RatAB toxin-antitoxin module
MANDGLITVEVVFSPRPRTVNRVTLQVVAGATVGDVILQSAVLEGDDLLGLDALSAGIWGRKTTAAHVVRHLDRIEIYRALRVDPKVARRERFVRQGARTTGLFATKRPGGKAGY